jgi:adenylyl-sulfate kinase
MTSGMTNGVTIWLTGLPSAGKSTIAGTLSAMIEAKGHRVIVLDGDEVRERLNKGLGFSKEDRDENVRRIAYVARLLTEAGAVAIVAAISPYRAARDAARTEIGRFAEIHVDCPLDECIRRDVKGLYRKALAGTIGHFTGVSDPYEPPLQADLVIGTHLETPFRSAERIVQYLQDHDYLPADEPSEKTEEAFVTERLAPLPRSSEA